MSYNSPSAYVKFADIATIDIEEAPYYASGDATTTTTVGALAAGSTSMTVEDASSFSEHQDLYLPGAGAAGAQHIATVTSVIGNVIHFAPATITAITPTTTVTTGVNPPGTSITVAAGNSRQAGHGVTIVGAGAGGSDYYGVIMRVLANTLTVSPATQTAVGAGTVVTIDNVLHDNTAAFQAAMAQAAVLGSLKLLCRADGFYRVNGPYIPGHAGRQYVLRTPTVLYETNTDVDAVTIVIAGPVPPPGNVSIAPRSTQGGAVIQTEIYQNATWLISGYNPASVTFGPITNVRLVFENITLRSYDDPNCQMVDGKYIASVSGDLQIDTGIGQFNSPTFPTWPNSTGIELPFINSYPNDDWGVLSVQGYSWPFVFHENTNVRYLYVGFGVWGIYPISASPACLNGYAVVQQCTNCIGGSSAGLYVANLQSQNNTHLINDPTNELHGIINLAPSAGLGDIIGGVNLQLHYLSNGDSQGPQGPGLEQYYVGRGKTLAGLSGPVTSDFEDYTRRSNSGGAIPSHFVGVQNAAGTGAITGSATHPTAAVLTSGALAGGSAQFRPTDSPWLLTGPVEAFYIAAKLDVPTAVDAQTELDFGISYDGARFMFLGIVGAVSTTHFVLFLPAGSVVTDVPIDNATHIFELYHAVGGSIYAMIDGVVKATIAAPVWGVPAYQRSALAINGATAAERTVCLHWSAWVRAGE